MPRIDDKMLKGLNSGSGFTHSERYIGERRLNVSALVELDTFAEFVDGLYNVVDSRWGMYHHGSDTPVTREELHQYAITAVVSRVMRVRNERFHIRCDDAWTLPAPLAAILAGIGRITLEAPVLTIIPSIDKALIDGAMTYDEWWRVSNVLRGMEQDPNCKFVFAHAIAGEKDGDEALMSLIPVTDDEGRLVELRQRYEIHPIAAAAYLILGLRPEGFVDGEALAVHPLLRSPHFIRIAGVRAFLSRFYDSVAA
jgi:hypothetical protein